MIELLDILKETDLRVRFTDRFHSLTLRENLDRATIQKRLLVVLSGTATNVGLKRVCAGGHGKRYRDVLCTCRSFLTKDALRAAIADVANAIFRVRLPDIWGEGTTACASDSKKFAAWDQNLMTEWHARYRGPGVLIYWHVERKAVCIYSQLTRCSSSEVAAMITGLLRHASEMQVDRNYVDIRWNQNPMLEVLFSYPIAGGIAVSRGKLTTTMGHTSLLQIVSPDLSMRHTEDLV